MNACVWPLSSSMIRRDRQKREGEKKRRMEKREQLRINCVKETDYDCSIMLAIMCPQCAFRDMLQDSGNH